MRRKFLQSALVLTLLLVSVAAPVVIGGYSELRAAEKADSYIDIAEHYRRAAERLPWRSDLFELAGHAYYHAKNYLSADAAYEIASERDSLSAEGWVAWGDVNYLNGDELRANEIWEIAFSRGEISDPLYSRLAGMYQRQGEFSKAAQFLQQYVSVHVKDGPAHYRLGLLLTLSDSESASSEFIIASQLDPQFDPSTQALRSALNLAALAPSLSQKYVIIGSGLGLVDEWQLAHAAFQSAVQVDEKNAEAWAWLGEANQQLEEDGSVELDRALELNPNSSTVRGLRGLHFQRAGNYRQALAEYQTAASIEPNNPARLISIGDVYVYLGDLIRALEAYQTATTLAPDDVMTWRALAKFCAQNNVYVKEVGVPAAQRALNLESNSSAEDLLGWLWLLAGSSPDAERHLLRAIELDAQNASAYLHLGMLYLQAGDRARAFEPLIHARDLGNSEAGALLNQFSP